MLLIIKYNLIVFPSVQITQITLTIYIGKKYLNLKRIFKLFMNNYNSKMQKDANVFRSNI